MKKLITILLAVSLLLTGCGGKTAEGPESYKQSLYGTFDTRVDYMSYSDSQEDFDQEFQMLETEFKRLHKIFDIYHTYDGVANAKTLNDAKGQPVKVEPELLDLIEFSIEHYDDVHGKTNIALGPVLKLWHDFRESEDKVLPTEEALQEANKHTDIHKIKVDKEAGTVQLLDPEMRLDFGAVAKGYATELVARKLESEGVDSALISAGGNVRTIGVPKDLSRKHWGIAITNPDLKAEKNYSDILFIDRDSVVTSGDYQRTVTVNGKSYHHIIDPKTLQPATYYPSVSVVTENSALADYLSTALFLSSKEEAQEIIKNFDDKIEVLWINYDGSLESTDGLKKIQKSEGAAIDK